MPSRRVIILLFATLCVVFAGFAFLELISSDPRSPDPSRPSPTSPESDASGPIASFSMPALSNFANVSQRPLFSPDRRPAARSADNSGAWSSFALAGIIITPQSREALVSHGKPPTIAHLAEGQTIEGWTVRAIYSDHVVFSDRLTEHELRLVDKTAAPPPPPPAGTTQRRPPF